ncbi:hypothetical protein CH274_13355 [Rhodococcus sp. 06-418-5]|uniref:beta-sandwich lipoprotein n=1 Tax=Rhodococcus sp. 06-418-5 TaxID=2022507 RepID=UPI000B9C09DF|nr:hypothetical protein [Rhodococcus sp. 06-418-5]OZC80216.1 hypothetical protein CH274_13355 [Rhodococcus sp. 06-418-5]
MTAKRIAIATVAAAIVLAGCGSQNTADVASENISTAAANFEIAREITTINNVTGDFLQVITGRCNIEAEPAQLEVTCQSPMGIVKNFVGLNAVTTYKVDQLDPATVSVDQYRVVVNPSTLIPDVDVK